MQRHISLGFAILSLLPAAGFAQEFRGTITGRVLDAQSAAIPHARVAAVLVATGAQSVTLSGTDGQFTIPFLSPGVYRVEAEAPGFKRYAREKFEVAAGERPDLRRQFLRLLDAPDDIDCVRPDVTRRRGRLRRASPSGAS